ncbi:MAG TPA: CU044_5270 family protein [Pseudonocardiaceae bacterium]|nr:CU044_5270 family protein [Pseudonocardiaceae bacterium]
MTDPSDAVLDEHVADDEYLLLQTHGWSAGHVGTRWREFLFRTESWRREWIPGDRSRDWLSEHEPTGARQWLAGSEKQAIAAGFADFVAPRPGELRRAAHGEYHGPIEGSWQTPTLEFLASLPRDPGALYRQLCADSPSGRAGYVGPFVYAVDALRGGLVPADLRAALYRALRSVPGLRVVPDVTNPDGAPAIALLLDHSPRRTEVFVDPATGHFAGERDTCIADVRRGARFMFRAGWVLGSSSVTRAVVDGIGVRRGGATIG